MEQPPEIEKKEQLEQFEQELQEAVEAIQSAEFLVETEQLTAEEARQMQFIFTDFESWESVKDQKDELVKIMQNNLGEHREAVKQYEIKGTGAVGTINVNVYPTDQEGVNLAVYKYKDGDVAWAVQPEDFAEEE